MSAKLTKAAIVNRTKRVHSGLADLMNAYDVAEAGVEKRALAVQITRCFDEFGVSSGDVFIRSIMNRIATHYSHKALI
tara:strand:+ start:3176 stop:3409 length:234 start_codon:yes stop_codon:yes gene_type:complete